MKEVEALASSIRNKKYSKILSALRCINNHSTSHDVQTAKDLKEQEEILRLIIRNDVHQCIHNKCVPNREMLEVLRFLEDGFQKEIKRSIIDYIVGKYSRELGIMCAKVKHLNEISGHFRKFEAKRKEFISESSFIPDDYALPTYITLKFCLMTSESINHMMNFQPINHDHLIEAIECTIDFEIKNTRKIDRRDLLCYEIRAPRTENNAREECLVKEGSRKEKAETKARTNEHKGICYCNGINAMSLAFSQYAKVYVDHLFLTVKDFRYTEGFGKMEIIDVFINFFESMRKIYSKISYLGCRDYIEYMIDKCDQCLYTYLTQMKPSREYIKARVKLNTLEFVSVTMNELIDLAVSTTVSQQSLRSYEKIRSMEFAQSGMMEKILYKMISDLKLDMSADFSKNVIKVLEEKVFTEGFEHISNTVSNFILESIVTAILCRVSSASMNPCKAVNVLVELDAIKKSTKWSIRSQKAFNILEDYVKIFLVPCADTENFITGFQVHSRSRFSFKQILSRLEDKKSVSQLYITYRSSKVANA